MFGLAGSAHSVGDHHVYEAEICGAQDGVAHIVGDIVHLTLGSDIKDEMHFQTGVVAAAHRPQSFNALAGQEKCDFSDTAAVKARDTVDAKRR